MSNQIQHHQFGFHDGVPLPCQSRKVHWTIRINWVIQFIPGFDMNSGNLVGEWNVLPIVIFCVFGVFGTSFHSAGRPLLSAISPRVTYD